MEPRAAAALLFVLLAGCAAVPDRGEETQPAVLDARAREAYSEGRYETAHRDWSRALELARAAGDEAAVAPLLVVLSRVSADRGLYLEATELADEALALAQSRQDEGLEARARTAAGVALRRSGAYAEAERQLDLALALAEARGDRRLKVEVLRETGAVHQERGEFPEALERYEQSLALGEEIGYAEGEAAALNNLGGLSRRRADYPEALELYGRALELRRGTRNLGGQAKVLGNLCLAHLDLRDFDTALAYCEQSLAITRRIGDRAREANNLNNLGALYRLKGETRKALTRYQASVEMKRALGDRAGEARGLNNIGEIHWQAGRPDQADAYFSRALRIKEALGDRAGQSAAHYNLGLLALTVGDQGQAQRHFRETLAIEITLGGRELLWRALDGLSRVHAARDRPALAIFFGKGAVNTLQSVRRDIRGLDPALQRSYVEDKERAYRHLADLLIAEGRLPEAEQVLAMLKEQEYFEFIRGDESADALRTEAEDNAFEAEQRGKLARAEDQLVGLGAELLAYERIKPFARTPEQSARIDELQPLVDQAYEAFISTLDAIQAAFAGLDRERYAELKKKALELDLRGLVRELSEIAGKEVVLVHYLVLDDGLRILLTTSRVRLVRPVEASPAELNTEIDALSKRLKNPSSDPLPAARVLYDRLIAPIAADLEQANAQVMVVSLDGALRYIPLAALHDGERYLAERYRLAVYTAAARHQIKDRYAGDWYLAALGLSRKLGDFDPLPAVPEELEAIVRRGPDDPDGVLEGTIRLDEAFTDESFRDSLHDQYPMVHVASHFVFRPGTEADSFLLLGDGKRLDLGTLRLGDYDFSHVDLLTLSACETAVEGERAQGREIEGFGTLAQNKGAKGVVATLWPVADESTARFMAHFYRYRLEGASKAAALQKAQLQFIQREGGGGGGTGTRGTVLAREGDIEADYTPDPDRPYAHPFYWAPFILMGNWL